LYRQSLEGWRRLLGEHHPETIAAARKLLVRLQAHGKPVAAELLGPAVGYGFAEMGQWDKALAGFARAFELELPKDSDVWWTYACLLLQTGDTDSYRKLCGRLLERFGQSKEQVDIFALAQICVLGPQALPDASQVLKLAEQRMAISPPSARAWSLHVLGFAYYRAGRYEKAIACVNDLLTAYPGAEHDVTNWLLLAMAEQRLGHEAKARVWFDKADRWVKGKTSNRGQQGNFSTPPGYPWTNWLVIQINHHEAESLMRGKITGQPPQKGTDKPPAKAPQR
jgi:tetratricopeptide (TPR) repeat protein